MTAGLEVDLSYREAGAAVGAEGSTALLLTFGVRLRQLRGLGRLTATWIKLATSVSGAKPGTCCPGEHTARSNVASSSRVGTVLLVLLVVSIGPVRCRFAQDEWDRVGRRGRSVAP